MPGAQQYRQAEFDENGNDAVLSEGDEGALPEEQDVEVEAADAGGEVDDSAAPADSGKKYRIGDVEFDTAEEALAYARTQTDIADAYRQGVSDAVQTQNPQASATPAQTPNEPEFNEQLYYENPGEFLKQYTSKVEERVISKVTQSQAEREASDRVWAQFTSRHPELADFRNEVEAAAGNHLTELTLINKTKGLPAGFDFVALKVKENFQRYARAVKPARQLPNTRQVQNPGGGASVTPKKPKAKPLSMAEQVRSIKPKALRR